MEYPLYARFENSDPISVESVEDIVGSIAIAGLVVMRDHLEPLSPRVIVLNFPPSLGINGDAFWSKSGGAFTLCMCLAMQDLSGGFPESVVRFSYMRDGGEDFPAIYSDRVPLLFRTVKGHNGDVVVQVYNEIVDYYCMAMHETRVDAGFETMDREYANEETTYSRVVEWSLAPVIESGAQPWLHPERRLAIAQIEGLHTDLLRKIADLAEPWHCLEQGLAARGHRLKLTHTHTHTVAGKDGLKS